MAKEQAFSHGARADGRIPLYRKIWNLRNYTPYPRAHDNRVSIHNKEVRVSRVELVKAAGKSFAFLQLLFFTLFCYIFGSLYYQGNRVHNLNVAFVDYDGGAIGQAIRTAYGDLKSNAFLTLQERSPTDYPDAHSLKYAVCKSEYWAALYITKGSSDAIADSLTEGKNDYDRTNIVTYIWNEARYSTVIDAGIAQNLAVLSNAARPVYAGRSWSNVTDNQNAYNVFANPWTLSNDNIQVTSQGSRLIYNTLVIILIMIQEFFYLGTLNQLYELFKIYQRLQPRRIIFFRNLFSAMFCLSGSLFVTSAIWIFKFGWHVDGGQFMLTWMVLWLFAHVNFLTLDVFTIWLPMPFVPMALITWVALNVTSILLPFELQSDFYKWSYAMPAHEVYNTLIDIWSRGCNPVLRYSLPVLFTFEVSSFALSALGIYKRCHFAVIRAEAENANFQERVAMTIAFEKKKRAENEAKEKELLEGRREKEAHAGEGENEDYPSRELEDAQVVEDRQDAEDFGAAMKEENIKLNQLRKDTDEHGGFGPAFGLCFGPKDTGHDNGLDTEEEVGRPSRGTRKVPRTRATGASDLG